MYKAGDEATPNKYYGTQAKFEACTLICRLSPAAPIGEQFNEQENAGQRAQEGEVRAIIEDQILEDLSIAVDEGEMQRGNIYKGTVATVETAPSCIRRLW